MHMEWNNIIGIYICVNEMRLFVSQRRLERDGVTGGGLLVFLIRIKEQLVSLALPLALPLAPLAVHTVPHIPCSFFIEDWG